MDKCIFCGCEIPEVLDRHRILPGSRGGRYTPENVLRVCANCHRKIHAFGLVPTEEGPSSDWVKLEQLPLWQEVDREERQARRFVLAPEWYVRKSAEGRAKSVSSENKQPPLILQNNALLLTPPIPERIRSGARVRPYILRKYEDAEILIVASSKQEAERIGNILDALEHAEEKGEVSTDLEMHPAYLDPNTGQMYISTNEVSDE